MGIFNSNVPRMDELIISWKGKRIALPYFLRPGSGPAILFVHGLGGCKENFYLALQSLELADCTLVSFDQPGTGCAEFDPELNLDVTSLAEISHLVATKLLPGPYFLAGASMGGLIGLLQLRRYGVGRIQGFINIEGNLCSEDCMFSRRVIEHKLENFEPVYSQVSDELAASSNTGDRMIAVNLNMNVDIRGYHRYSFETVRETDSGKLLPEFLALPIPRLFLYGDENRSLSYLSELNSSEVEVQEVPESGHFLFYDNPVATYRYISQFVNEHSRF